MDKALIVQLLTGASFVYIALLIYLQIDMEIRHGKSTKCSAKESS
jgi:hypothetical protein